MVVECKFPFQMNSHHYSSQTSPALEPTVSGDSQYHTASCRADAPKCCSAVSGTSKDNVFRSSDCAHKTGQLAIRSHRSSIIAHSPKQSYASDSRSPATIQSAPAADYLDINKISVLDAAHVMMSSAASSSTLSDAAVRSPNQNDGDNESSRPSLSSLISSASAFVNSARGLTGTSGPDSVVEFESECACLDHRLETAGLIVGASAVATSEKSNDGLLPNSGNDMHSPGTNLELYPPTACPTDHFNSGRQSIQQPESSSTFSRSHTQARHSQASSTQRSRSKTRDHRRLSRNAFASVPGSSTDRSTNIGKKKAPGGIIGVCALDSKARSKASRNILNRLIAHGEFDVIIFGDKVILDEKVENWPVCDFLISFFSTGFPLDKAIAYSRLRKPYCVNDLPMQTVLWDRRWCLKILDTFQVPTPKRLVVNRDNGPTLACREIAARIKERTSLEIPTPEHLTQNQFPVTNHVELLENDDLLIVDGQKLRKPFVEKPVSGEDHNIHIYYPNTAGGGGRRLFRKINNKSSAADDKLNIPRAITEPTQSFIYEQFVEAAKAEDIKAYTVGPSYCHAETRKSPVVDGIVKRSPTGKELRYITELTPLERDIATRVVQAFGQTVCGFDLLRSGGKSYVIDVNGWSFVKDNNDYYDKCSRILRDMFLAEKNKQEIKESGRLDRSSSLAENEPDINPAKPATSHRSLKSMLRTSSLSMPHHVHHHSVHHTDTGSGDSTTPISASMVRRKDECSASRSLPQHANLAASRDKPERPSSPVGEDASGEHSPVSKSIPAPASSAQWTLKGMVSVVRHADRTPKQKLKFTFHTKPFVNLLRGHQEEVLIAGESALQTVLDAVNLAIQEGKEDMPKLQLLKTSLVKKGGWAGTKIQIKPMFRSREDPASIAVLEPEPGQVPDCGSHKLPSDTDQGETSQSITLSRISAAENNLVLDKLQLIIKWGGEPTHSARYQAQDLGENLRNDLLLMNRDCLEHVMVFSSSERRVTTSAQIFASSFLGNSDLPADFIQVRKDLLDDSNAAKDEMDKVKKKLKQLLREGDAAPPEFAWPEGYPEPFLVVGRIVELMNFHYSIMTSNYQKLRTHATSALAISGKDSQTSKTSLLNDCGTSANMVSFIQQRWCSGEDADLFKERWEKLFKEFTVAEKVDPGKISELYDTLKFDALHNRQFLEWIFMPDLELVDSAETSEVTIPEVTNKPRTNTVQGHTRLRSGSVAREEDKPGSKDWKAIAHKIGLRRSPEPADKLFGQMSSLPNKSLASVQESYFELYRGQRNDSKAKHDARLSALRELYTLSKTLFDYIGPQEYGISPEEKLSIGLLTSLPLLKEIVYDLEEMRASDKGSSFFYFTKESHIYTLLNCIVEGGIKAKITRKQIPELDYLSQINFELYESQNALADEQEGRDRYNYSIRITISPGCHTLDPLDLTLDSKHCIGIAARRSLTAHNDYKEVLETLRAKFHTVKLPKSFIAISLSELSPQFFGPVEEEGGENEQSQEHIDPVLGLGKQNLALASNSENPTIN